MNETLVALLTPPGRSALATLGVAGPRAWTAVRELFTPRGGRALPELPAAGRRWLGQLGADIRDEAMLFVRRCEPFPAVEMHTHGGREVTRYVMELLAARGLRPCGWEEFVTATERDAIRAAALAALSRATTTRTASILLDQYHGALQRALTEASKAAARNDHVTARNALAELHSRASLGLHLTRPFRVVIAGAPNVGKSTLVNALAGYERSIVSPVPGTTRDVVTIQLAIGGWPVELADTAGLRAVGETLESLGIGQARAALEQADLCLWLLDASAEPVWPESSEGGTTRGADAAPLASLVVVNKTDCPPAWDLDLAGIAPRVSAATGEGIADLCAAIARRLVPSPPPAGAAVPFTEDQVADVTARLCAAAEKCPSSGEPTCT